MLFSVEYNKNGTVTLLVEDPDSVAVACGAESKSNFEALRFEGVLGILSGFEGAAFSVSKGSGHSIEFRFAADFEPEPAP